MNKELLKKHLHLYTGCEMVNDDGRVGRLLSVNETCSIYYKPLKIQMPDERCGWWGWDFVKPILRPFSDMTKGEYEIWESIKQDVYQYEDVNGVTTVYHHGTETAYLLSIHIDLFRLIDAGLAVDASKYFKRAH